MLAKWISSLCEELALPLPPKTETHYLLSFGDSTQIQFFDLSPGVSFKTKIRECPKQKKEDLFLFLMRANLLGQGTGECRIGLNPEEKFLTLSLGLPYELNYKTFREKFEDFLNYLVYWKEEIDKFEKNTTTVL